MLCPTPEPSKELPIEAALPNPLKNPPFLWDFDSMNFVLYRSPQTSQLKVHLNPISSLLSTKFLVNGSTTAHHLRGLPHFIHFSGPGLCSVLHFGFPHTITSLLSQVAQ